MDRSTPETAIIAGSDSSQPLEGRTLEELIQLRKESPTELRYQEEIFRRSYPKVLRWCQRMCSNPDAAADLAQEVLLKVHSHLDTFKGQSRFSTWLYTVTRRVAINRLQYESRRKMQSLDVPGGEPRIPADAPSPEDRAATSELVERLRKTLASELSKEEIQVLYLHFADGMTLPEVTHLMQLKNKSGAKAYVVSAKRRLSKTYGKWLNRQGQGKTL